MMHKPLAAALLGAIGLAAMSDAGAATHSRVQAQSMGKITPAALASRIGLAYMVTDLGETPDGQLLFFETDPAAIVHALDDAALFPYKVRAREALFAAFRAMLMRAAG